MTSRTKSYKLADYLPPPPKDNQHWLWMTEDQESLLLAATRSWQTKRELVASAGLRPHRDHGAMLRFMVAYNILVAGPDGMFRLHPLTTTPVYPRVEYGARRRAKAS